MIDVNEINKDVEHGTVFKLPSIKIDFEDFHKLVKYNTEEKAREILSDTFMPDYIDRLFTFYKEWKDKNGK